MIQSTLFSLHDGEAEKLNGQKLVEMHNKDFVLKMRSQAQQISAIHGSVCSDDLREYAASLGIRPKHQNAWGSIFRGPAWKVVGRIKSHVVSNHAREVRRWTFEP